MQQLFDWMADGVSLEDFVREFQIDREAAATVLRAAGHSLCASKAIPPDQRPSAGI